MRNAMAACLGALLLLAGCLGPDAAPGSGSRTTPATTSTTSPTIPSPTRPPTTTSIPTVSPPTTPSPVPCSSPASAEPSSSSGSGPGGQSLVAPDREVATKDNVTLYGNESQSGFSANGSVTFSFAAVNGGADGERLMGPRNPTLSIRDENGTAVALAPGSAPPCADAVWLPFASGDRVSSNWTWNGTTYHGDEARKAPPGRYVLTAAFHARRGLDEVVVSVDVRVNVIPSDGPAIG